MSELTVQEKENLKYLRSLGKIIIPAEYTYWCHNTMYKPVEDCKTASDKRCWNEIPTDTFTTKKEMSFVTRIQRVNAALDYGNKPSTSYANTSNSFPFQIRVLQPKHEFISTIYENPQAQKSHYFWERGLGDGRHPKIPGKIELYAISFSETDDVSDETIDIVYFVTREDISTIANLVRKIQEKGKVELNQNLLIKDNRAYEENVATVLTRSVNRERFFDTKVNAGQYTYTIKQAGYKEDYKKLIKDNKR